MNTAGGRIKKMMADPSVPNDEIARALAELVTKEFIARVQSGCYDCVYCGDMSQEVDHIMPKSRGGSNLLQNLAPSCRRCNREKLDFTPEEWREWRISEGLCWPPESLWQLVWSLVGKYM